MSSSFDLIQFVKTLKLRKRALEEALQNDQGSLAGQRASIEELQQTLLELKVKKKNLEQMLLRGEKAPGSESLLSRRLLASAETLCKELADLRGELLQRYPELSEENSLWCKLETEQVEVARLEVEASEIAASNSLVPSAEADLESRQDNPYLQSGHILGGRYKVAKILGQGGTGAVYGVTDQRTPQVWALKELWSDNPSFNIDQIRHQLYAEVRVLSGLRHPNLPRIVDAFEEKHRHYIVMDYIEGQSLSRVLHNHKKLPIKHALEVGLKLSDVLCYLHSQEPPIIFRDLKPANIMVKENGDVKLVDFGIARYFAKESSNDTQALGTPGYAAPEQYGGSQSDQRSDVYALGANLHQMLTGINPGLSPFRFDPVRTHCSELSVEFEQAVSRCVELDQSRRPQTVQEVREEILQEIRRRNGGTLPLEIVALLEVSAATWSEDSGLLNDTPPTSTEGQAAPSVVLEDASPPSQLVVQAAMPDEPKPQPKQLIAAGLMMVLLIVFSLWLMLG